MMRIGGGQEGVMFQFFAITLSRLLEAMFDEIEYRVAKRSIRHAGFSRARGLLGKY
jgi:hypothetical protein